MGLHQFEELDPDRDDVINFSLEELYYRCVPGRENGVHIEGFLFEPRYWSGVREKPYELGMKLCVGMFEATGSRLDENPRNLNGAALGIRSMSEMDRIFPNFLD